MCNGKKWTIYKVGTATGKMSYYHILQITGYRINFPQSLSVLIPNNSTLCRKIMMNKKETWPSSNLAFNIRPEGTPYNSMLSAPNESIHSLLF